MSLRRSPSGDPLQSKHEAVLNGRIPTAATRVVERVRVLALKVELDWKNEDSRALYNRLRDLGWMAAHYRNMQSIGKFAQVRGWRVDPEAKDKNDISKQLRKTEKGELSGDAYSQAEQEVQGSWTRDGKKILAGQPPPMWRPSAALSVSGKQKRQDSGIRLEMENDQYVLYLRAQAKADDQDSKLRIPIAKHSKRDEHQGEVLNRMVSWEIPIKKATVHLGRRKIIVRLTYRASFSLPPMGSRVATFGPLDKYGNLYLRTETQSKDYTSRIGEIMRKKDEWELIRRRVTAQIGWKKGHARAKRRVLASLSWDDWLKSWLHTWSAEMAKWCQSQGVGTICVVGIDNGDWPAHRLMELLTYKAEALGMQVVDGADVADASAERAAKAVIAKGQKAATRRNRAVRELDHQITKGQQ